MARPLRLSDGDADVASVLRALDSTVALAVLRALVQARRKGEGGWLYLTQLAQLAGVSPGSASAGLLRLAPFIEERREKGQRHVRASITDVVITLERPKDARHR